MPAGLPCPGRLTLAFNVEERRQRGRSVPCIGAAEPDQDGLGAISCSGAWTGRLGRCGPRLPVLAVREPVFPRGRAQGVLRRKLEKWVLE